MVVASTIGGEFVTEGVQAQDVLRNARFVDTRSPYFRYGEYVKKS